MGSARAGDGACDGCRRRIQHRYLTLLSGDVAASRLSKQFILQEMAARARRPADRQGLHGGRRSCCRPRVRSSEAAQARQVWGWRCRAHHGARQIRTPCPRSGEVQGGRSCAREEHSSGNTHAAAALRARPRWRDRTRPRLSGVSGLGRDGIRREPAMALHRRVRRGRIMGPGRRPDGKDIDRCVRALSGGGMMDAAAAGATSTVPGIPRDTDGPVFREPWEAQAFAMALALHERGLFTWTEWAATLANEIRSAQAAGDPDNGATYYHHWLSALERLVAEKNIAGGAAL